MATLNRIPAEDVTIENLKETNPLYLENKPEWKFLMAAYEGCKELVKLGYLRRNERESNSNYDRRKDEAYGFEYSRSIVDLFNFYLFKKPVKRDLEPLENDNSWKMFFNDCNLYGDPFDDFLTEVGRYASVFGFMGILVDKPSKAVDTKAEEIEAGIYPYISLYYPTAILDWAFSRDENNRPFLSYLKLLDDDGQYRVWYPEKWETWEVPKSEMTDPITGDKKLVDDPKKEAKKVGEGINKLGFIPFVWVNNIKGKERPIGRSDIHGVARLDLSIIRNLSQGEEVIDYGAFPMMRKPEEESSPGGTSGRGEDEVGVTAVLTFPPDNPEAKPDWLEAKVLEPINAILKWIERKVAEIYRAVNAGGMASMEISNSPKSGTALKAEFQLLNATLVRKATNLEKAERQIIKIWLEWENKKEVYKDISIERSRTYDVEDLATDLENTLTAQIIVKSPKFNAALQKQVVRQMLPAAEEKDLVEMDNEIDELVAQTALNYEDIPIYDGNSNQNFNTQNGFEE